MKQSQKTKLHIKLGDLVQVIAGDEKKKKGKVKAIFYEKNRATVEGLNMVTYHVKPTQKDQKGGRKQKEAPIHISNLMVVDPTSDSPSRIGRRKNDKGKLQRYAKKTNQLL